MVALTVAAFDDGLFHMDSRKYKASRILVLKIKWHWLSSEEIRIYPMNSGLLNIGLRFLTAKSTLQGTMVLKSLKTSPASRLGLDLDPVSWGREFLMYLFHTIQPSS